MKSFFIFTSFSRNNLYWDRKNGQIACFSIDDIKAMVVQWLVARVYSVGMLVHSRICKIVAQYSRFFLEHFCWTPAMLGPPITGCLRAPASLSGAEGAEEDLSTNGVGMAHSDFVLFFQTSKTGQK